MAEPISASLVIKAAATIATDKRIQKIIGAVIAAVLSPIILVVAVICAILGGGGDHNKAAFSYTINGGAIPADAPDDYRKHLEDIRSCFTELDTVIDDKNGELSEGSLNSMRIKALFYSLHFGNYSLNFHDSYYADFVNCFINEEEVTNDSDDSDESVYIVYSLIKNMESVYSNASRLLGREVTANELTNAENLYNNYFYGDNIPDDTYDFNGYWSNADINYLGEGTETRVVYFNQADKRWGSERYGRTGTIASSGCGPTALAMVVSTLSNRAVNPSDMAIWAYENGYRVEGSGSSHSLMPNGGRHYGLKVEGAARSEGQKVVDALAEGKLVIAIMSKGHFTNGGHFIVLRGITSDGQILVADPASIRRSEQSWPLSIIISEASQSAGSGGPFWIFSP